MEKYFTDIREQPPMSDQEMNAFLADISRVGAQVKNLFGFLRWDFILEVDFLALTSTYCKTFQISDKSKVILHFQCFRRAVQICLQIQE